ncbi:hypothetical protein FQZ97_933980 [compost metagenome]
MGNLCPAPTLATFTRTETSWPGTRPPAIGSNSIVAARARDSRARWAASFCPRYSSTAALAPVNQWEATSARSGPMTAALPANPGMWQLWQVSPLKLYGLSSHSS